ncbi:MAG: NRDE family protein [Flavobacteriaceae bacterium]|nr:NRDE family protein [Flavobacteriaceae bacterium]
MCTVTFVPQSATSFILTSNRDEAPNRNTLPPKVYAYNGVRLLFPKDELAGGTWIGVSDKSRFICLLNGGFQAHERAVNYRKSRGIIVTDLLVEDDIVIAIENYGLDGVEPFTLILVDWKSKLRLFELVWDGNEKHFSEKPQAPHIWSSSLLYSSEVKKKRESWFSLFLSESTNPSKDDLLQFHKLTGEGNPETNLIMDRGFVKAKSISQFLKNDDDICFRYEDLQNEQITMNSF